MTSNRTPAAKRPGPGPVVDPFEPRRLLSASLSNGVLKISGTEGNDTIVVERVPGQDQISVSDDGVVKRFNAADVVKIRVIARDGNDRVEINQDHGAIKLRTILDGGAGKDTLLGGGGRDNLFGGTGSDRMLGRAGSDTIEGGSGVDRIDGGAGDDHEFGNAGDDLLVGGDGADDLHGNEGNDELDGQNGDDSVSGEAGNDRLQDGEFENETTDGNTDEDDITTSLQRLTEAVRNALRKSAGFAFIQQVTLSSDNGARRFEAVWNAAGRLHTAVVDARGQLIERTDSIVIDELPKAVVIAVQNRFPDGSIVSADRKRVGNQTTYDVTVGKGGESEDVEVTTSGEIVDDDGGDNGGGDNGD